MTARTLAASGTDKAEQGRVCEGRDRACSGWECVRDRAVHRLHNNL